jgi:hypothetical protein
MTTTDDPGAIRRDGPDLDRAIIEIMESEAVVVAPGVKVWMIDNGAWVTVRAVLADEPRIPGAVGAWLDTLPHDRRVIVPFVVSTRLAGMLERRGFVLDPGYQVGIGWDHARWTRSAQVANAGRIV